MAQRNQVYEEDLQIFLSKCFSLYKSDRPARLPRACLAFFLNLALTSIPLIDPPIVSIKCQSFMRICLKFSTAGCYCVTKGKISLFSFGF